MTAYVAGRNHETADLTESDRKGSIVDRLYHGITSSVMDEGMPRHGASMRSGSGAWPKPNTPPTSVVSLADWGTILLAIRAYRAASSDQCWSRVP